MIVAPSAAVPARATGSASSSSSGQPGTLAGGDDAGGQPVERFGQQGLEGRAVPARPAGVGQAGTVDAAPHAHARPAPSRGARRNSGFTIRRPGRRRLASVIACVVGFLVRRQPRYSAARSIHAAPACGLVVRAALKHQHVDHHVGARRRAHAAFRQAHRADQVGHAGDVLPRRRCWPCPSCRCW